MAFTDMTFAQHLDDGGFGTFNPTTAGGTIYLNYVPDTPNEVVVVTVLGGDNVYRFDGVHETETQFQVRVRGEKRSPQAAQTLIADIADYVTSTGFTGGVWAEGSDVEGTIIYARASVPYMMGMDENHRPEWGCRITVRYTR